MTTRRAIREYIADGLSGSFSKTFNHKPAQLYNDELPSLAVFFEDGETERDYDTDPDTEARVLIEITASRQDDIDGYLDELAEPVEAFIRENRELGGLSFFTARTGFRYDRDPESFLGTLQLEISVKYEDED